MAFGSVAPSRYTTSTPGPDTRSKIGHHLFERAVDVARLVTRNVVDVRERQQLRDEQPGAIDRASHPLDVSTQRRVPGRFQHRDLPREHDEQVVEISRDGPDRLAASVSALACAV